MDLNNTYLSNDNADTIFCTNCGFKNKKSAHFCPKCGEKLDLGGSIEKPSLQNQVKTFDSIADANAFFRNNKNIQSCSASYDIKTQYGIWANHSVAHKVTVSYYESTQEQDSFYQIAEIEKTQLFKIKENHDEFIGNIRRCNPTKRIVSYSRASNLRTASNDISFYLFKFSTEAVQHDKYFLLYKVNSDDQDLELRYKKNPFSKIIFTIYITFIIVFIVYVMINMKW